MGKTDGDLNLGGLKYTSIGFDKLGASSYTLVGITVDETGSVSSFKKGLEDMLFASLDSCKKSPNALNLLVRSTAFNNTTVRELHGFELLSSLDLTKFKGCITPGGYTNLFDAATDMLDAFQDYGKKLQDSYYGFNGVFYIITDGEDNNSRTSLSTLADKIKTLKKMELFEELHIFLIGINDADKQVLAALETFQKEAELDAYISMGDVTPQKLAKLGGWVSQSISAHSQGIQTGAPSQQINLKF